MGEIYLNKYIEINATFLRARTLLYVLIDAFHSAGFAGANLLGLVFYLQAWQCQVIASAHASLVSLQTEIS